MAKDPAFLFYPNDWIGGTMGMTFEEKGAYVELLMLQFNRGHMTKHMIAQSVGHLWVKIEDKFRMDKDGLYYNARLDLEKERRKNYTKSRRNNVSGKNQYSNKVGHMSNHMEDVDVNENIIDNNSIVYKMFEIFKKSNFEYPEDKKLDSTALYEIANKISKKKNILQHEMLNGKMNDVLESWKMIVGFIISDTWFSTRSLTDINKEWQRLIQSITNKNKNNKAKNKGFIEVPDDIDYDNLKLR